MEKKIYYYDTDAGGIVYYGQYLCYLEEARTEFLEKRGLSVGLFQERGFVYVVRQCNVSYRSPARYGDTLLCEAKLKKMGASQLVFDQTVHDKKDGRLIVEAEVSLVCLNKEFKPTPIPDDLKKNCLLEGFCGKISPMSISKEDVKYIAALARIDVPEDKLEGFAKSLGGIVQYVEQLQKLDVTNVKPTSHAVPVGNVLRPDVIKPSLTNQEALAIAVEAKDGSFKVPLVIE